MNNFSIHHFILGFNFPTNELAKRAQLSPSALVLKETKNLRANGPESQSAQEPKCRSVHSPKAQEPKNNVIIKNKLRQHHIKQKM
jgi:hypothetical protein